VHRVAARHGRNDTRRLTLRHRLPNDLVNPSQHGVFESSRVAYAARYRRGWLAHCPDCQTAVKTLKDRRPSRLLK
jgi:hypothetical protein